MAIVDLHFLPSFYPQFIEELEEAEEWERDEVEELESQTADALAEHAKELALFMKVFVIMVGTLWIFFPLP